MDRLHRCSLDGSRPAIVALVRFGVVPLLLAAALAPACRADSTLQTAAPGGAAISASAHLDFRITVLPSLALSTQAGGAHIQSNSGVLTLQRDALDGRASAGSAQLRPRHRVIDTAMQAATFAGSERITIASP